MADDLISIVGVLFDTKKDADHVHKCGQTTVFGLSAEEHKVFSEQHGIEVTPREFNSEATRYQMKASPWLVMRVFGTLGYQVNVTPISDRVRAGPTGERRTGIYTLQKAFKGDRNAVLNV